MELMKYAVLCVLLAANIGEAASLKAAFGRVAPQHSQVSTAVTLRKKRQFTSGRKTMAYLVAVEKWKAAKARGLQCPPPNPCECHCDCPVTNFEKPPTPPEPCPIYPSFPTTPAPVMRITEATPAPLANNQVHVPGFSRPISFTNACAEGEIMYSDGECVPITREMIQQLIALCAGLKANLDQIEHQSRMAVPAEYIFLRLELMTANDRYRRALDLLLSLLGSVAEESAAPPAGEAAVSDAGNLTGPEFVDGRQVHRAHCEPWSKNATHYQRDEQTATINTCGVICRNQPTCVGFAIDPQYGWCVWYDNEVQPPFAEVQCSNHNSTRYIKMWEGPQNATLWLTMEKAHAYERKWRSLLLKADTEAEIANRTFEDFWEETNITLKNQTMHLLISAKNNYTATLVEAQTISEYYFGEAYEAYRLTRGQVQEHAPFQDLSASLPAEEEAVSGLQPVQAYAQDLRPSPTPVPLRWQDFPNAGDTEWSQQHPECPMGPPCYCACECRGAPPQNFVANPPPPPQPCPPPPPTPNPFATTPLLR